MNTNAQPGSVQASTPAHPYAKKLESQLETQRKMFALLQRRVVLLKEESENPHTSDLARVEAEIGIIRTEGELSVLERVITHKTKYYDEYMEQFEKDIKECDEKLTRLLNIAAKSTKPVVQRILTRDLEATLANPEAKINLYKTLKKHV